MNIDKAVSILSERLPEKSIILNADMSKYCSFRCGGRAALLLNAENQDELRYILYVLNGADAVFGGNCGRKKEDGCGRCGGRDTENAESGMCSESGCACGDAPGDGCDPELLLIGNGSNLLVRDGGFDGIVLKLGAGFGDISCEGSTVTAGASALLSRVAAFAKSKALAGLEFASGIPASAGGAIFMNAGAYGGEMKDVVKSVKIISKDGLREAILYKDELELSYRKSILQNTGDIVTEVTYELEPGNADEIDAKMRDFTERRTSKQPLSYPSAGSFFKRPEGYFAGALIEGAGLKGLSVGGAQVSPLHAGFIVNKGNASARDIISLMKLVQNTVYDKNGVWLAPEVRIVGRD